MQISCFWSGWITYHMEYKFLKITSWLISKHFKLIHLSLSELSRCEINDSLNINSEVSLIVFFFLFRAQSHKIRLLQIFFHLILYHYVSSDVKKQELNKFKRFITVVFFKYIYILFNCPLKFKHLHLCLNGLNMAELCMI